MTSTSHAELVISENDFLSTPHSELIYVGSFKTPAITNLETRSTNQQIQITELSNALLLLNAKNNALEARLAAVERLLASMVGSD